MLGEKISQTSANWCIIAPKYIEALCLNERHETVHSPCLFAPSSLHVGKSFCERVNKRSILGEKPLQSDRRGCTRHRCSGGLHEQFGCVKIQNVLIKPSDSGL